MRRSACIGTLNVHVCTSRILSLMNLKSLKTSVSRKTIFSDDISCMNFIVVWKELAKEGKEGRMEGRELLFKCLVC